MRVSIKHPRIAGYTFADLKAGDAFFFDNHDSQLCVKLSMSESVNGKLPAFPYMALSDGSVWSASRGDYPVIPNPNAEVTCK